MLKEAAITSVFDTWLICEDVRMGPLPKGILFTNLNDFNDTLQMTDFIFRLSGRLDISNPMQIFG